jgi:hypothetical protein
MWKLGLADAYFQQVQNAKQHQNKQNYNNMEDDSMDVDENESSVNYIEFGEL